MTMLVADLSGATNGNADATGKYLPVVCALNAAKVTDLRSQPMPTDVPPAIHPRPPTRAGDMLIRAGSGASGLCSVACGRLLGFIEAHISYGTASAHRWA